MLSVAADRHLLDNFIFCRGILKQVQDDGIALLTVGLYIEFLPQRRSSTVFKHAISINFLIKIQTKLYSNYTINFVFLFHGSKRTGSCVH